MKKILIVGGTGRLGHAIIERIAHGVQGFVCEVGVFSRSAEKQKLMAKSFAGVEFFEGDVASYADLRAAVRGFDVVIHAAAMKDVVGCQNDIEGCVATNFTGMLNALNASKAEGVARFIHISTDMAVDAASVYGHSKALADAAVVDAARAGVMATCVVRFGNILTPKGAIFDTLQRKLDELGYVPVTHPEMSRFFMSSMAAADFVLSCVECRVDGGEIFAPVCPSYDIMNVARVVANHDDRIRVVGLRDGDALTTTMISRSEALRTAISGDRYIVFPVWRAERYAEPVGFESLTSSSNPWRATTDNLREFCLANESRS